MVVLFISSLFISFSPRVGPPFNIELNGEVDFFVYSL